MTKEAPGLTPLAEKDWPKISKAEAAKKPIERLAPNSTLHATVLAYLLERLKMSEREISKFYPRWQVAERRVQAYVNLDDFEKILSAENEASKPAQVVSVTVPYAMAVQQTIVTYLIHTFCGRRPIFQIASNSGKRISASEKMELLVQYNADHTRLVKHMFQWLNDGQTYGVQIMKCSWEDRKAMRTVWKPSVEIMGITLSKGTKAREERTVYQGNQVSCIDPFMFFPDPRVPMVEVNTRGEFVFWRSFEGKHACKIRENTGEFSWINYVPDMPRAGGDTDGETDGSSARSVLSGGDPNPGQNTPGTSKGKNSLQIDQGTLTIIPAELGLSDSKKPEKWLFAIANKGQIIQATPFIADHDKHPVVVAEPYTQGYGFGQPGLTDFTGKLQDTMSWFVNSHMYNIRTALNNMFIVDPSMIEMQDLKNPEAGLLVRLKRSAYGQDVRSVLTQLNVSDVTRTHISDLQNFMRLGDAMIGVNENLRGILDAGGRKTATEVRTSGEAGASRLAAQARLISSQGLVDLTEMMVLNNQQGISDEFYIQVVGEEGKSEPLRLGPEELVGDFYYPVHDGTLPLDRVALLDVWKQVFQGMLSDQELRSQFDISKVFGYIANLGGAKNVDSFKRAQPQVQTNILPPGQEAPAPGGGNVVPLNSIPPNPGARIA